MTSAFKVLLYEPMHGEGTRLLQQKCEIAYAESLEEDSILPLVTDVDAIILRANGAITRRIMENASRLKVIGRHGVGLDAVDLDAARSRGIKVVYTPVANTESVAEHFVALALMLAKKMRLADMALRAGDFQARYRLVGTELRGKTLGVLGFGRIGRQTARICRQGFRMPVLYSDIVDYPEVAAELGACRMETEEIFRLSDFISINMPLLPGTKGCINRDLIELMKPTAFLINMARGPIWNEAHVVQALREKLIAGAGSVVYEVEPVSADNPLLEMENFVGTPHMSAHTEEAMIRMSLVAEDVLAVLEGRSPEYPAPGFEN